MDLPSYHEMLQTLRELRLGVEPSELHGALCGLLCAGATVTPQDWLRQLALETAAADAGDRLAALFEASCSQLADPEMALRLLLPAEDAPLAERADALIGWTRGFLGGFGLAGGEVEGLSEEAREALQDLSQIAGAQLSYEDPDSDESSLAEIEEFVRVAALLLQQERQPRPDRSRMH